MLYASKDFLYSSYDLLMVYIRPYSITFVLLLPVQVAIVGEAQPLGSCRPRGKFVVVGSSFFSFSF